MNAEEINRIARNITIKWIEIVKERSKPSFNSLAEFHGRIQHEFQHVLKYEDWDLQEEARNVVPVDKIHEEAKALAANNRDLAFEDFVIKRLLHWFKNEFFQWVNEPQCDNCNGKTQGIGSAQPTSEELKYGASRVEHYQCLSCKFKTRFPRYNHPGILLRKPNRRGRCGEWANCFALICRAMGFETRHVIDWTDHVWVEYYSDKLGRWIHLDPCEAAFDSPLLYEAGWGKKLNYVIACSGKLFF
jgi:peptide-N4-(N-acetyl-beta-glucosaminyl)asparagine amidase